MHEPSTTTGHGHGAGGHLGGDHGHEPHAHGGTGKYWMVFLALCVLTTGSFMTYFEFWREHVPPHVSWAFMMAISCTKAMLVILFFMHLLWEANWKYVLTIPAAFMSVFLVLVLIPDIGMRTQRYTSERWLDAPAPVTEAVAPAHGAGESEASTDHDH